MPPTAVLSGLLQLVSFCLSDCVVEVPNTHWVEPVLLWITVAMPSGSGKTPLFSFLMELLEMVKTKHDAEKDLESPDWTLDEASFEKMGAMMAANSNKLLGMYDELGTFLSQINAGRGKSESHELTTFLSLYNAKSWKRSTSKAIIVHQCIVLLSVAVIFSSQLTKNYITYVIQMDCISQWPNYVVGIQQASYTGLKQ